nr:sigma-70 family RNA polymerase sigma factor [Psychroserpens luteolus]
MLVKRWHLVFCQKAFWILKDPDLSKDIAQDTWRVVINKIEALNNTSSFGSWALRIVCSKSFDELRKQNIKRSKTNEFEKTLIADDEIYTENEPIKKMLIKAINELPEHQQIVIKLFYTENYSLKDISKILHVSVGTVKSRLFHAREKLKKIIKTEYYEN